MLDWLYKTDHSNQTPIFPENYNDDHSILQLIPVPFRLWLLWRELVKNVTIKMLIVLAPTRVLIIHTCIKLWKFSTSIIILNQFLPAGVLCVIYSSEKKTLKRNQDIVHYIDNVENYKIHKLYKDLWKIKVLGNIKVFKVTSKTKLVIEIYRTSC